MSGGSGNAISCSLLYQHRESFQDEVTVAALNVAVGKTAPVDYLGKSRLAPLPRWGLILPVLLRLFSKLLVTELSKRERYCIYPSNVPPSPSQFWRKK
jgi:hypothetical protein